MSLLEEALQAWSESREFQWKPVPGSQIVDFYSGKNILVTGATGFFGKLLVEKLLRACPDLNSILIIVRPKKGVDEMSRVEKLYNDEIFGPLTKLFPKFIYKIRVIKGDTSLPGLGITAEDLETIKEQVDVIHHMAATVNFEETLPVATAINVRATRDLLQIAKECKKLKSFVYVSTAYTHCNRKDIDEVFYDVPITGDELIKLAETSPKELEANYKKIMGSWPNSYTFTKAVAEDVVKIYGRDLPISVVRPAIVVATYKEPLRSWIDNLYGATGIVIGAGTGLLKTMECNKNTSAEIVPGDYVINQILAASYKNTKLTGNDIPIYNYVSSVENRVSWKQFRADCFKWAKALPTVRCVWYFVLIMTPSYYLNKLYTVFLHYIPGLLVDLILFVTGQKPIMMKVYKKIDKFASVVAYFATQEWNFTNKNVQNLWIEISEADKKAFPFSMKELDWVDYQKTHSLGLRTYVVKDDISTLPKAMVRWQRFYVANQVIKGLFYLLVFYLVYLLLFKLLFKLI